jgi:hypothetical protein
VGFDSHGDIRRPAISLLQVKLSDRSRQDLEVARIVVELR